MFRFSRREIDLLENYTREIAELVEKSTFSSMLSTHLFNYVHM